MAKDEVIINADTFKSLNIEMKEVIEYLENKKMLSMKPIHIKAYHYLKNQPAVASS